jgi:hypothetical protein
MKNLEALTKRLEEDRNPAAQLGRFLLGHSNSPGYLAAHLADFTEAVQNDLKAEKESHTRLFSLVADDR